MIREVSAMGIAEHDSCARGCPNRIRGKGRKFFLVVVYFEVVVLLFLG
jgi:hypothetical protein